MRVRREHAGVRRAAHCRGFRDILQGMEASGQGSMQRDIVSAYVASAAKVGSWLIVSAMVFRRLGADAFAMLALVRATLGILNYTSLGLAPGMIALSAGARRESQAGRSVASASRVLPHATAGAVLDRLPGIYSNAMLLAVFSAGAGLVLVVLYAFGFTRLLNVPIAQGLHGDAGVVVVVMGVGMLARLMGEVPGACIQTMGRIGLDNGLSAGAELAWLGMCGMWLRAEGSLTVVALAYLTSGLLFLVLRWLVAERFSGVFTPTWALVRRGILRRLLGFGALVVLSQAADYLYAPAAYILINKLIGSGSVAVYAPALQIDSALLLLVSAIAAVLLPRSAAAHAAGEVHIIRAYYVRGTVASFGILAAAAMVIYAVSPWILTKWLGDPMKETQAILGLVLIHTVVGGSSGVARSVLLALGKARPFAISAIVAGVANVVLGYIFVRHLRWGVNGIVIATIIAVVLRCGVWMPWYALRLLRQAKDVVVETAVPAQV